MSLMATRMSTWTQGLEITNIGTDFKRKNRVFSYLREVLLERFWHMPKKLMKIEVEETMKT